MRNIDIINLNKVFFSSFNILFFLGMVVLSFYVNDLINVIPQHLHRVSIRIIIPILNGLLTSLIAIVLTKFLVKKRYLSPDVKNKKLEISIIAFIAGVLTIYSGISVIATIIVSGLVLCLTIYNIKSFTKKIAHLLQADQTVSYEDLGKFVYFFINLIITFTVINLSLFVSSVPLNTERAFNFSQNISSIVDALYFTVITMTTVGFGDLSPQTSLAKIFVIIESLTSYIMFALMIGVISRGISNKNKNE